jgi:hypothetical protein
MSSGHGSESMLGRTYIGRDVQLKEREWHSVSSLHLYKGTSRLANEFQSATGFSRAGDADQVLML